MHEQWTAQDPLSEVVMTPLTAACAAAYAVCRAAYDAGQVKLVVAAPSPVLVAFDYNGSINSFNNPFSLAELVSDNSTPSCRCVGSSTCQSCGHIVATDLCAALQARRAPRSWNQSVPSGLSLQAQLCNVLHTHMLQFAVHLRRYV